MSSGVTACCAAASAAASTVAPRARNCGSEKTAAGARPSTATTVRRYGSRALLSAPGGDPSSSGQRSRSASRKRRPRKASSVINAAAPECSKAQASSRGVENVLRAATTAPILAAPKAATIHSVRLVTSRATRSPRRMPTARNARANSSTRALRPA